MYRPGWPGGRARTPNDGFMPNTPQNAAGILTDPAPSVPWATGPMPAATAAADPPLDPPDVRDSPHGLRVGPISRLPASPFQPNSEVFVFPRMMAPAARRRSTTTESVPGTQSFESRDPNVVRKPRVGVRSLMEIGIPSKGRGGPSFASSASSTRRASALASSRASVTKALSDGLSVSIRSKMASTTSTGETMRRVYASRSSSADLPQTSTSMGRLYSTDTKAHEAGVEKMERTRCRACSNIQGRTPVRR